MRVSHPWQMCAAEHLNTPMRFRDAYSLPEKSLALLLRSGITKAVVRPSGDNVGVEQAGMTLPSSCSRFRASEPVATSPGWRWAGCGRCALGKWPFPTPASFLTSHARNWVFPAPICSQDFHLLCSDSAVLPCSALPSRSSPGLAAATMGMQPLVPAGHPQGPAASPGLQEPQHGRGTGHKALSLFQHPGCVCLSLAFCML